MKQVLRQDTVGHRRAAQIPQYDAGERRVAFAPQEDRRRWSVRSAVARDHLAGLDDRRLEHPLADG